MWNVRGAMEQDGTSAKTATAEELDIAGHAMATEKIDMVKLAYPVMAEDLYHVRLKFSARCVMDMAVAY